MDSVWVKTESIQDTLNRCYRILENDVECAVFEITLCDFIDVSFAIDVGRKTFVDACLDRGLQINRAGIDKPMELITDSNVSKSLMDQDLDQIELGDCGVIKVSFKDWVSVEFKGDQSTKNHRVILRYTLESSDPVVGTIFDQFCRVESDYSTILTQVYEHAESDFEEFLLQVRSKENENIEPAELHKGVAP